MTTPPRHRRRRVVDLPTERIEPVPPAWAITRTHWLVLALVMVTFTVLTVEPVRNVFLLGLVVAAAVLAEVLAAIGSAAEWITLIIRPVLDYIHNWF